MPEYSFCMGQGFDLTVLWGLKLKVLVNHHGFQSFFKGRQLKCWLPGQQNPSKSVCSTLSGGNLLLWEQSLIL